MESEDSLAGVAVDVEAVGARRPFGEALFDEVMRIGVGGSAVQPILKVELEAEALLVVKRQTGIATEIVQSLATEAGPMRRVAEPFDLLGDGAG